MAEGWSGTTRARLRGLVAGVVAAALLAAGLLAAGSASADPVLSDAALTAKAKVVQARLDDQHTAMERLTERIDAVDDRLGKLTAELADLRARRAAVAKELAAAQKRLDDQARATYMAGPEWFVSELVGAVDPADALRRIPLQKAALEAQAAGLDEVRTRKAELDGVNQRLAADAAEVGRARAQLAAERAERKKLADQLQATLDSIDRRLAGFLAAERLRLEVARRAAWAGYMAGRPLVSSLPAGAGAAAAVRYAMAQLGDPYRWGAEGPDAYDCSGLTSAAYLAAGVAIPRTSAAQWGAGPHVDVAALLPGDLVFYADDAADPSTIHHVGMYIGNGLMVHAPHTGDVVRVASVWREGYAGAVRVTGGAPNPVFPPPPVSAPPTTAPPPPPMPDPTTTTRAPTTTTRAPTTTVPPTTATSSPSSTTTTTSSPTTTTRRHRH